MLYWPTIWLLRVFFALFTRFKAKGLEKVPHKGPFLLISNHISHFDPPVFSAACTRSIDWMGSEILFRNPISNWFFIHTNVIKVRQYEADQGALRQAVKRLKQGRSIGLFPEGGIRAGEKSILGGKCHLYEGAFMIAVLTRAPVVPCLVIGSDRLYNPRALFKRVPIWVRMGDPIPVEGKGREEVARLKAAFEKSVRQLAEDLRTEGETRSDDWPQTPQARNPHIPPPKPLPDSVTDSH